MQSRHCAVIGTVLLALAAGRGHAEDGPAGALPVGDWRVDPANSHVRLLVFRGGLLGRLGHNHVVSHHELEGCARFGEMPGDGHVSLSLAVDGFRVDDAAERRAAGERFPVPVPADDVEATRKNMLGPDLLDAASHPRIAIDGSLAGGRWPSFTLDLEIGIAGGRHRLELPATMSTASEVVRATGGRTLTHEAIGLKPFSAALGTLRVASEMLVSYEISLVPAGDSGCERALAVVDDDGVALADDTPE